MGSNIVFLTIGIGALLAGGDLVVRGGSRLSRLFGISPFFIGLTVVAFGSSAPELVVTVLGSIEGRTEIAFGNVVGSNLANIGLVLAIAAILASINVRGRVAAREIPLLIFVTAILLVLGLDPLLRDAQATIDRSDGVVLLALFGLFLYVAVRDLNRERNEDPLAVACEVRGERDGLKRKFGGYAAITIAGLTLLVLGGQFTIENASQLAVALGASEVVIGMGIVALGTSLPELVTTLFAAYRSEPDLAIGNLVGSNLFNTTFVLAIGAIIAPLPVPAGGTIDLVVGLVLVMLLLHFAITGPNRLVRWEGLALLGAYAGYIAWRFT